MVQVERRHLSGSTDGKPIKLTANSSPGDLIHTATSSSMPGVGGVWDEVHAYVNIPTSTGKRTTIYFEVGGVAVPDDSCQADLPSASGLRYVIPGLIFQNGAELRAYYVTQGSAGDPPTITGYVNRITN